MDIERRAALAQRLSAPDKRCGRLLAHLARAAGACAALVGGCGTALFLFLALCGAMVESGNFYQWAGSACMLVGVSAICFGIVVAGCATTKTTNEYLGNCGKGASSIDEAAEQVLLRSGAAPDRSTLLRSAGDEVEAQPVPMLRPSGDIQCADRRQSGKSPRNHAAPLRRNRAARRIVACLLASMVCIATGDAILQATQLYYAIWRGVALSHQSYPNQRASYAGRNTVNLDGRDASFADLRGCRIEASCRRADFSGANLTNASFSGDMTGCRFVSANLEHAVLGDDLNGCSFESANLSQARLEMSSLYRANFRHARLRGADLTLAQLWHTDFRGADLTGVKLDNVLYDSTTLWPPGFDPRRHGAESAHPVFTTGPFPDYWN